MKMAILLVEDNMDKQEFVSQLMAACEELDMDQADYNGDTSILTLKKYDNEVQAVIKEYTAGCLDGLHADYLTGPFTAEEQESVLSNTSDRRGAYEHVTAKSLIRYIRDTGANEYFGAGEGELDPWE